MRISSYGNFQVGMVDDPSVEDKGGFEFASGIDIFSEPGVLKACNLMTSIPGSFGTSLPRFMATDNNEASSYLAIGDKVYRSTDGETWSSFLTDSQGTILGLEMFNGYVWYAASTKLGRCPVNDAPSKNDSFATINSGIIHPMVKQGGTLKIGCSRYVASVDEASVVTTQALKLPIGMITTTLEDYLTRLFAGVGSYVTEGGTAIGTTSIAEASVFDWRGTVLSSGSALPDNVHKIRMRNMNALVSDGSRLFAFPDLLRNIHVFDGVRFVEYRKLYSDAFTATATRHGAVSQSIDSLLFSGDFTVGAGVFQMKSGAVCQAFVPSSITPGATSTIRIGFVKAAFNGRVLIGYLDNGGTARLEISSTTDKQNSAFIRTVWHRMGTDKLKRMIGVKPNAKPLASGCSIAVGYRTTRNAAFTDSGYTITSANQDKPVILAVQPRSREIQFQFTLTTNGVNTPELLPYDVLYEPLNSIR
jgi:hypothetical protein